MATAPAILRARDLLQQRRRAALTKKRPWNPDEHPRDRLGRFIEVGAVVDIEGIGVHVIDAIETDGTLVTEDRQRVNPADVKEQLDRGLASAIRNMNVTAAPPPPPDDFEFEEMMAAEEARMREANARQYDLSPRAKQALNNYAQGFTSDVNRYLRLGVMNEQDRTGRYSDRPVTRQREEMVLDTLAGLDLAFEEAPPLAEPLTVHRADPTFATAREGDVITELGFPSTTELDLFRDGRFGRDVAEITVPAGAKAIRLADVRGGGQLFMGQEKEVVLERGGSYRVVRVDEGPPRRVYVEWIPPASPARKTRRVDWDPSEHPRGADGRFISIGDIVTLLDGTRGTAIGAHDGQLDVRTAGGKVTVPAKSVRGSKKSSLSGMRPATGADRKRLRIPPAWTDVLVSDEPDVKILAVGRDAKGREQRRYSSLHDEEQSAKKFARVAALNEALPKLDAALRADRGDDTADALTLIRRTGLRPGSTEDRGAEVQAYGATTLLQRHVTVTGDRVALEFTGKKGVPIRLEFDDPEVAAMLAARKGGPDEPIFPKATDVSLRDYMKRAAPGFKVKDLRTHIGTGEAARYLSQRPRPESESELKKLRREVANHVAALLGNTPTVALSSYIDPTVFSSVVPLSLAKAISAPVDVVDAAVAALVETSSYHPPVTLQPGEDPFPPDPDEPELAKAVTTHRVRPNPRWDPAEHPRDRLGRFIAVGGWVALPDGKAFRVSQVAAGYVELELPDGRRAPVPAKLVTGVPDPPAAKPARTEQEIRAALGTSRPLVQGEAEIEEHLDAAVARKLWYLPYVGPAMDERVRAGEDPDSILVNPADAPVSNTFSRAIEEGRSSIRTWGDVIRVMEQDMRPLQRPAVLHRGAVLTELPREGEVVPLRGITSLTADEDTAESFAFREPPPAALRHGSANPMMDELMAHEMAQPRGGQLSPGERPVRFEVEAPAGTVLWDAMNDLEEFVLPPGHQLRIVSVDENPPQPPSDPWYGDEDDEDEVMPVIVRAVIEEQPRSLGSIETSPQAFPASELAEAYRGGYTTDRNVPQGGQSTVELLTFLDGRKAIRKNHMGLAGHEGEAKKRVDREVLAGLVANALGITDISTIDIGDERTLSGFIEGRNGFRALNQNSMTPAALRGKQYTLEEIMALPNAREIGLLDWLADNSDRHEQNWLVTDDERVVPIDHGQASFVPTVYRSGNRADYGKERELVPDSPFTAHWLGLRRNQYGEFTSLKPRSSKRYLSEVRSALEELRPQFEERGRGEWLDAALSRLERAEAKAPKTVPDEEPFRGGQAAIDESPGGDPAVARLAELRQRHGDGIPLTEFGLAGVIPEDEHEFYDEAITNPSPQETKVPVSSLWAQQDEVSASGVQMKLSSAERPVVVKDGATYIVVDGHHALAAAILRGDAEVDVLLTDMNEPAAAPTATDLSYDEARWLRAAVRRDGRLPGAGETFVPFDFKEMPYEVRDSLVARGLVKPTTISGMGGGLTVYNVTDAAKKWEANDKIPTGPQPRKITASIRFPVSGFNAILPELDAIASEQLFDALKERRETGKVSGDNLLKLRDVLRAELDGGLLTYDHLKGQTSLNAAKARGIVNQGKKLLQRVEEALIEAGADDAPAPPDPERGQVDDITTEPGLYVRGLTAEQLADPAVRFGLRAGWRAIRGRYEETDLSSWDEIGADLAYPDRTVEEWFKQHPVILENHAGSYITLRFPNHQNPREFRTVDVWIKGELRDGKLWGLGEWVTEQTPDGRTMPGGGGVRDAEATRIWLQEHALDKPPVPDEAPIEPNNIAFDRHTGERLGRIISVRPPNPEGFDYEAGVKVELADGQIRTFKQSFIRAELPPPFPYSETAFPTREAADEALAKITPTNLSERIQQDLRTYVAESYDFNRRIRIGGDELPEWGREKLARIDEAIAQSVVVEPVTVHRAVVGYDIGQFVRDNVLSLPNARFSDQAFVSTTTDERVADRFLHQDEAVVGGGFMLQIDLAPGTPALHLPTAIDNHNQKEVLLPRNQIMEVVSIDYERGVIHARTVPKTTKPIPKEKLRTPSQYHALAQANTGPRSMAAVVMDAIMKDLGLTPGTDFRVTTVEDRGGDRKARTSILTTHARDTVQASLEKLRALGVPVLTVDGRVGAIGEFRYGQLAPEEDEGSRYYEAAERVRRQLKLPAPPGISAAAGRRHMASLGEKRRAWMQRKSVEVLSRIDPQDPERPYWEAVRDWTPDTPTVQPPGPRRFEVGARVRVLGRGGQHLDAVVTAHIVGGGYGVRDENEQEYIAQEHQLSPRRAVEPPPPPKPVFKPGTKVLIEGQVPAVVLDGPNAAGLYSVTTARGGTYYYPPEKLVERPADPSLNPAGTPERAEALLVQLDDTAAIKRLGASVLARADASPDLTDIRNRYNELRDRLKASESDMQAAQLARDEFSHAWWSTAPRDANGRLRMNLAEERAFRAEMEQDEEYRRLQQAVRNISFARSGLIIDFNLAGKDHAKKFRAALRAELEKIRPMAKRDDLNVIGDGVVVNGVKDQAPLFPLQWVRRSNSDTYMRQSPTGRFENPLPHLEAIKMKATKNVGGDYHHRTGILRVVKASQEILAHELTHRFENVVPGMWDVQERYWQERTNGKMVKMMGYGNDAYGNGDEFKYKKYAGRVYREKKYGDKVPSGPAYGYELMTTGMEQLHVGRDRWDEDQMEWVIGVLARLDLEAETT